MFESIEISEETLSRVSDADFPGNDSIIRVNESMTYDDFFAKFLVDNRPCIVSSRVTDEWPCRQHWVSDGSPNFERLDACFGESTVPIADCNKRYYNSQFKDDMTMRSYLRYWTEYRQKNYPSDMPLLYLKDWHCAKEYPKIPIYNVPLYFTSDWLNEYYISHPELNDDYMFVYMGPKGTWTPLHADVFTSYSWSANIVGKKQWLLFPPREDDKLRDLHGQLAYDATSSELNDKSRYKMYDCERLKSYEVTQNAGEIIFVPSGWHHQVWNLEDTISINHNWINACNIFNLWTGLKKELVDAMKEVEDCRDMSNWSEHCQLMLKVSYGMDYSQFYDFISFIARKRLDSVVHNARVISFNSYELGTNHCLFDLKALRAVLEDFINDTERKSIHTLICKNDQACVLLNEISSTLRSCIKNESVALNSENTCA